MTPDEITAARETFRQAADVAYRRNLIGLSQQCMARADDVEYLVARCGAEAVRRMVERAQLLIAEEGAK